MRGRRQRGPWQHDTGVCEKITPPEKKTRGTFTLCKHQIRGWIAVSPAVVQGKGLRKRSVFSQAPVVPKVAGPKSCIQGSARGDLNNVHEQAFTKRRLRTFAQGETDGPDVTSLTKIRSRSVHEPPFTSIRPFLKPYAENGRNRQDNHPKPQCLPPAPQVGTRAIERILKKRGPNGETAERETAETDASFYR